MKCPICGAPSDVKETRPLKTGEQRRRRRCYNNHMFNTRESHDAVDQRRRKEGS